MMRTRAFKLARCPSDSSSAGVPKEAGRPRRERDQVEHRDGSHDPLRAGETNQTLQPPGPWEPLRNLTMRVAVAEAPVTMAMPMAIVAVVAVMAVRDLVHDSVAVVVAVVAAALLVVVSVVVTVAVEWPWLWPLCAPWCS